MSDYHEPVLVNEVIEGLNVRPGKKYIDATVGGGGHLGEIVRRGGIALGIDVDREALEYTRKILNLKFSIYKEDKDWKLVQGNFRNIEKIARENGFTKVDGVLFDLGISSHQIDTENRGFSYRFPDGLLDLRLDQTKGETAASLVNRLSEEELYDVFAQFGEEELAHPIARAICRARSLKPMATTGDMVTAIEQVVRDKKQRMGVLSRIFQALRIVVNGELEALTEGLKGAQTLLNTGGRLVVISFHSLEDRKVKLFYQGNQWKVLTKRPMIAPYGEIRKNPRAKSAKLRIAEKL